jgi:hypothetical protein
VSLVRKRAIVGDVMMSLGTLAVLIAILASFDERMRQEVMLRVHGDPSAQMANASATAHSLMATVITVVRSYSIEHAPMVIFVVLAVVLLGFMLRT